VVLYPAIRAVPTNSDGSYQFRGLPPGEYSLFAVGDRADPEYANPAAISPTWAAPKSAGRAGQFG
jgi:hypothetical protein